MVRTEHSVSDRFTDKLLPLAVVAGAIAFLIYAALPPSHDPKEPDLYAFGKLPLVSGGRVEPMDTLARNSLRLISLRESFLDSSGIAFKKDGSAFVVLKIADDSPAQAAGIKPKDRITELNRHSASELSFDEATEILEGPESYKISLVTTTGENAPRQVELKRQSQPAIKWLAALICRPELADQMRVFRIESIDVLNMLGLDRRLYRYSFEEINKNKEQLDNARKELQDKDPASLSVVDKKLGELFGRLTLYEVLRGSFLQHPLPPFPNEADLKSDEKGTKERVVEIADRRDALVELLRDLMTHHPPLAVPMPDQPGEQAEAKSDPNVDVWEPYTLAWLQKYSDEILQKPVNPSTVAWEGIFDAYAAGDAPAFNRAVAVYAVALDSQPPPQLAKANPGFEAWFMHWGAFFGCQWLYFIAFCFAALAWLGWSWPLNRTAFWLISVTFLAHTIALISRMYISGRPPVTNLYSSAIFIGWGAVLVGLILESIYRNGFGNIVASIAGMATLIIADRLALLLEPSTGGDTIGVMQAVLDTQFWLALHVTSVVTGYTATYVAGLLGLVYVIRGLFTSSLTSTTGKDLARMIYGTVCFAMFFSFFGTVLGGLWADDSWGRFWGWDPKENGALIIVLWNALVLHARWDGLVKDRGLAVLAIGGNIVTSWSYFGVNQLGVGLHSYGFTEGVLPALGLFCLSQVAVIAAGLTPLKYWRSRKDSVAVA